MCLWGIYIFSQSVCLFCCRKICWPILGIYRSFTDTNCGNWDWGRAIPFLGKHKWDFRCSACTAHLSLRVTCLLGLQYCNGPAHKIILSKFVMILLYTLRALDKNNFTKISQPMVQERVKCDTKKRSSQSCLQMMVHSQCFGYRYTHLGWIVNSYPNPGFWWKKFGAEKFDIFLIKNCNLLIPRLP